jgi:hypothetical protein
MTFWTWEWILQEVQKIQILRSRYRDNIYPGTPLPPVYAQSVGGLGALLVDLIQRLGVHTKALLPSRPGFRAKWDVSIFSDYSRWLTPHAETTGVMLLSICIRPILWNFALYHWLAR